MRRFYCRAVLSLIMVLMLIATVFPVPVAQASIFDFVIENGVLTAYVGKGGDVVVPNGVKEIGSSAFYSCKSLTNVTIPSSVEVIGEYAFSFCAILTNVTIKDGVKEIGRCVFYSCKSLTNVTIPSSVDVIGEYAFSFCANLTNVNIRDGVKEIGRYAFCYCESLTSITIPSSVSEVGYGAFSFSTNAVIYAQMESRAEFHAKIYKVSYTAVHFVASGDNLSKIAKRYGVSWTDIYELNKWQIEDPDLIYAGQVFIIPD